MHFICCFSTCPQMFVDESSGVDRCLSGSDQLLNSRDRIKQFHASSFKDLHSTKQTHVNSPLHCTSQHRFDFRSFSNRTFNCRTTTHSPPFNRSLVQMIRMDQSVLDDFYLVFTTSSKTVRTSNKMTSTTVI